MTAPTVTIDSASIVPAPCRHCPTTEAVALRWHTADSAGVALVCIACVAILGGTTGLDADALAEIRRHGHVVAMRTRLVEACTAGIASATRRSQRTAAIRRHRGARP